MVSIELILGICNCKPGYVGDACQFEDVLNDNKCKNY